MLNVDDVVVAVAVAVAASAAVSVDYSTVLKSQLQVIKSKLIALQFQLQSQTILIPIYNVSYVIC